VIYVQRCDLCRRLSVKVSRNKNIACERECDLCVKVGSLQGGYWQKFQDIRIEVAVWDSSRDLKPKLPHLNCESATTTGGQMA
jgi:hypothetical protein